ncbi:MAG: type III polyketide synthase [Planctomycetes bacterium]|nr:type III polyketide synthase [Planctomycetota bacterium]
MKIAAAGTAFPARWYDQQTLTEYLVGSFGDSRLATRLRSLHENTRVEGRHLALPLERYADLTDFSAANAAWRTAALELGERAITTALERAAIRPDEVDTILFSTVTGLASPSIDALLMNRIGFRPDLKRIPMFGLGCVAGAAAVSRAADYLRGHRDGVALVLTIELCSLTLQLQDRSIANLISTGLFSDGAAATVLVGEGRAAEGPAVLATRSVFYPDTERVMGWDIGAHGFRIVLSAEVPTVARERLPGDVDDFLRAQGLSRGDIRIWIAHPGGPKVLQALQDGLELEERDLACSWRSLARAGNMSSASVLAILEETLRTNPGAPGDRGLMLAMGPGFCSELLLLGW